MTDTTAAPPAASSTATPPTNTNPTPNTDPTAAAAAAAAAGAGAEGAPAGKWWEVLPDGMKGDHNVTKYDSVEKFVEGHLHTLKRLGVPAERQLILPEKLDEPGALDEIWNKLGRPETVDGYELKLGEGATEEDAAFVKTFVEKAHAAGASKAVVAAAVEVLNGAAKAAVDKADADAKAAAEACASELTQAWGNKKSVYDQEIPKLVEELGGKEAIEALNKDGMGNSPTLLKMLAKVCDLRAEQGTLPGGAGGSGDAAGRAMTPAEAQSTLNARNADKDWSAALLDKKNPRHADVLAERQRLLAFINPAPKSA